MSAGAEEVIRTEALSKVYREGEVEVRALRGGQSSASRGGEFMAIAGPSGSGKSGPCST